MSERARGIGAGLLIVGAVVAAFAPVLAAGFVDWDDPENITGNTHLQAWTADNLAWMWTTYHLGHWQPLSWMSLGLDAAISRALFGVSLDPRVFHATSLLLHACSALLVWRIALRLLRRSPGGAGWAAVVGALLFAVHPLRVESVAWITERRDVLGAVFFLGAVLAWLRAREARRPPWVSAGLVGLSLLARAGAVVFPLIIMALELHLLQSEGRLTPGEPERGVRTAMKRAFFAALPFFVLVLPMVVIAPRAQHAATAAISLQDHPLNARLAQSCYGVVFYLWKTVAPFGLSPIYQLRLPIDVMAPRYLLSAVGVVGLAIGVIVLGRRYPGRGIRCAAVCFLAPLLPVLGVFQSGAQEVADRYSYLPGAVVGVAAAGLIAVISSPLRRAPVVAVGLLVSAALGVLTWRQCAVWHDSESFWTTTAARSPDSSFAHNGRGYVRFLRGEYADALDDFKQAVALDPSNDRAHNNIWESLRKLGREAELPEAYAAACEALPNWPTPWINLANDLAARGEFDRASAAYRMAAERFPSDARPPAGLALIALRQSRPEEALAEARRAMALDSTLPGPHVSAALALNAMGRGDEAIAVLEAAAGQIDQARPGAEAVRTTREALKRGKAK